MAELTTPTKVVPSNENEKLVRRVRSVMSTSPLAGYEGNDPGLRMNETGVLILADPSVTRLMRLGDTPSIVYIYILRAWVRAVTLAVSE